MQNERREGKIAIYDSGIGGLTAMKILISAFPRERFLYFGDNEHAPYGNLEREDLLKLATANLKIILKEKVKVVEGGATE